MCKIGYHGNEANFHGIFGEILNSPENIAEEKNSHHVASLGDEECPILGENYLAALHSACSLAARHSMDKCSASG